ncbi:MAG TPA: phosphoribosylanthranilate isomerase [Vicinamibacterales bacterium]|jgi:phosphoribosylanthranilate isomerase
MIVKICGITRLEDAEAAVAAGANAVGFVFWRKSPRFVDPYNARGIVTALPPFVLPVGLFVDQPIAEVTGVASLVRLGAVQLHGDEPPDYADAVGRPVIKALLPTDVDAIDRWPDRVLVLLDAIDPASRGGTGRTIDWDAAARAARRRRVLLAGGLTPENVAEAASRVRPFGVDVSSGVERAPGIKDPARMRAFFEAVHGERTPARS